MRNDEFIHFAESFGEAVLSGEGRLLACNQVARELLAARRADPIGQPLEALVGDESQRVADFIQACVGSDQPVVTTLLFQGREPVDWLCQGQSLPAADGGRMILLRCLPGPETRGDERAIRASLRQLQREIDLRRRVEHRLSSIQAHASAVLDTAADAIITIDAEGSILSFNPAAEGLFGYSSAEVMGHNVRVLMPAPYHDRHDEYMAHYLRTGEKRIIGIGREVQALRKNGTVFPIELAVSEVRIAGEHHFTGIIRDISERKQAEQQLRRQEEEARQQRERLVHVSRLSTMGELAAGIAHEINQPLTAIAAYANACQRLVDRGGLDPLELMQTLDKISAQAQRAGQIIQRLRDMIRRRDSQREACELNRLIRDTLVLAESDARLHNYAIVTEFCAQALEVVVDPVQIQQVLLNLIRNGLDAMLEAGRECGRISIVTLAIDEEWVEVQVHDQGAGIPVERLNRLFDPFFTTKPQGIGLGLSISRSIITAHGGRFYCKPGLDSGATMCFTLPLVPGV